MPEAPDPNPPPEWLPYFLPALPLLLDAADRDSDPDLYASLLLDQLPPEADPVVNELLADLDYPSNVLRELPPDTARAHQWLRALFLHVRDQVAEADAEELEP